MKKRSFRREDLLIGLLTAIIFIFLSLNTFAVFESLERIIYGVEMRLDLPRNLGRNKIATVDIDDNSLKQLTIPRTFAMKHLVLPIANKDGYLSGVTPNPFSLSSVTGEWNGNFTNWLSTRRIDAARKVMVEARYLSRRKIKTLILSPTNRLST